MARRAISMITFPQVWCMFMYVYIYVYIYLYNNTVVCLSQIPLPQRPRKLDVYVHTLTWHHNKKGGIDSKFDICAFKKKLWEDKSVTELDKEREELWRQ